MRIAKAIQELTEAFEKLPGIGQKTASRLTFYLLHVPQKELSDFANALVNLKRKTVICSKCFNVTDSSPCSVCSNPKRNHSLVCVVEEPLDVMAIEDTGKYSGVYHVLHGRIDPLNNIRPEDLKIKELLTRLTSLAGGDEIKEVLLATNPDMEGEATAMYLKDRIGSSVRLTRIGRGLPTGGDLQYADKTTLTRALEGRSEY